MRPQIKPQISPGVETSAEYINEKGKLVKDCEVLKLWNNNKEREGSHMHLPIPFRESHPELPNNWPMVYKRLMALIGRLEHNKNLIGKYTLFFIYFFYYYFSFTLQPHSKEHRSLARFC